MKKAAFAVFVLCVMTLMTGNAQSQTGVRKILVAYFTMPETDGVDTVSGASRVVVDGKVNGNLAFVATCIHKGVGGDVFTIGRVRNYPGEHPPVLEAAETERKPKARPPLATHSSKLQNDTTIFWGYPIWWYDLPMGVYRFLDEYTFAGKPSIPFTVHGGSRLSGTVEEIIQLEPQATVIKDALAISRNSLVRSERAVTAWLRRIGMMK
jgi:flavodoxin